MIKKNVKKQTVKDLKEVLNDLPDEQEIVLGFYRKDGVYFGYLSEYLDVKYDSVIKEQLKESSVLELVCYDNSYCRYIE